MSVEVANESGVAVDETALLALSRHVLAAMGVHRLAELSLLLVDSRAMAGLHERWMGEPGPTDVLAFPMDELDPTGRTARGDDDDGGAPAVLGDVVLCPQVAADQARTAGQSAAQELQLLCTHGILHLLGYDHAEPEEHRVMFAKQAELLESWQAVRSGGAGSRVRGPAGSGTGR